MEFETLCRLIELQPEMVKKLEKTVCEVETVSLEGLFQQLLERETAEDAYHRLLDALGEDKDGVKMLYCQLLCACHTLEKYREIGIPDKVFVDTMKCFSRFIGECLEKTGDLAFDRGWWAWRQLSLSLFRIGALEYEFLTFQGEKTICLHIPSDADLSQSSVDASLKQADGFFRTYFPAYPYTRYVCSSWLLSPVLKTLLPSSSRILAFQSRFQDIKADSGDLGFLEWLFQSPETVRYEDLPEHTSLQKKAKALLLSGGTIGAGCGMFPRTF